MIYMTAEQAEDFGLFEKNLPANVVILSEDDMQKHLRSLLGY